MLPVDTMAKVMVSEAEYAALKKAASAASKRTLEFPPTDSSTLDKSPSPAAKLDGINKRLIEHDNAKRRDIVEGKDSPEDSDSSDTEEGNRIQRGRHRREEKAQKDQEETGEDEEGGEGAGIEFSFLPVGRRQAAKEFLHRLLAHPAVDVECGQIYVRGKKIGHIMHVLHHLFGSRNAALTNLAVLNTFLRQSDLSQLLPQASSRRATSKLERKPAATSFSQKAHSAKREKNERKRKEVGRMPHRRSTKTAAEAPLLNPAMVAHLQH